MKAILLCVFGALPSLSLAHDLMSQSWNTDSDRETLRAHLLEEWAQHEAERQATREAKTRPAFLRSPFHSMQVASLGSMVALAAQAVAAEAQIPETAKAFLPFKKLDLREEGGFLYIGSDGLPDHNMMVGITAWQQQVPLPQSYWGDNAWRLPLHPKPTAQPVLVKNRFLRGAIALAVNGIPIFNPQNNRGEISSEIGELDQWGGHCGRADDYHYHIVPLHLQAQVGQALPVAYAMDGYPIYGLAEPDGSPVTGLDVCHGHEDAKLGYHYHASLKYPYVIGGFHGEVKEADGQVDPQPRAQPVRPALQALRGAKVTGFEKQGPQVYQLRYELHGDSRSITYQIQADGTYPFRFDNGREGIVEETYTAHRQSGVQDRESRRSDDRNREQQRLDRNGESQSRKASQEQSPLSLRASPESAADANGDGIISAAEYAAHARRSANTLDRSTEAALQQAKKKFTELDINRNGQLEPAEWRNSAPAPSQPNADSAIRVDASPDEMLTLPRSSDGQFLLSCTSVADQGELPVEYTGDGAGISPELNWTNPPDHTQSYALIMDHQDKEGNMKWYWTVYDIPASARALPKNNQEVGRLGTGFKGEVGYEPPHSKGAGEKTYVITLYALSQPLSITGNPGRLELLAAMQGKVLASSSLRVLHTSLGAASAEEKSMNDRMPATRRSERESREGPTSAMNKRPDQASSHPNPSSLVKPTLADTLELNVYADNWFMLYINGHLVAVDSIPFTPHNVVSVDFLPEYPMTIAVLAKDNADPKTGLEYGSSIGDGGFILKFSDGTVTNASWKAKSFFRGPLDANIAHPQVTLEPLPENWWSVDFNDSEWQAAREYSVEAVDPKQPYYDHDFEGAKFIWADDLALDNTVIFRTRIDKPDWKPRWTTRPDLDVSSAPIR